MSKHVTGLVAVILSLSALPAEAEMITSSGGATPATGGGAVARGDDAYRPTSFLGMERAQVLDQGAIVLQQAPNNLTPPIGVSLGLGNGLEVGAAAGLTLSTAPAFNLPLAAYAKKVLNQAGAMTVAATARANLGPIAFGGGATGSVPITLMGGLPVSLWKLGPGDLSVMPVVQFGSTGFNVGAGIGYEYPLLEHWTFEVMDMDLLGSTPGNSLNVGARVALTPTLSADVGGVSLNGSVLTINFLSIGGSFGGRVEDLRKLVGL
jgi:hypothetical protein